MNAVSRRPRVLPLDDDALVRRWVEAALEARDVELATCGSVEEARTALAAGPAALVVDAQVRPKLQALGVWRVLHKPLPLAELLACVDEALAVPADAAALAT